MRTHWLAGPAALIVLTAWSTTVAAQETTVAFDRDVAPILIDHCLDCHSGGEPKGELDLTTAASASKGGETGAAIVPSQPEKSPLLRRIAAREMPPKKQLAKAEIQVLRKWIAGGAKWGTDPIDPFRTTTVKRAGYNWWALQPVRRPEVPPVKSSGLVRNPIDNFVLKQLERRKLTRSSAAAPRTIVRRLYFDLIGLPPTPTEVTNFERAARRDRKAAIDELVDRLLASPHFGERWGRHWLDVVRFGESQGFERDKLRPNAWRYRDWVIDAFNKDLPYDEFVRLQLAGDILSPDDPQAITATGFLVAGPWDEVGQNQRSAAMKAVVRQDEIEDYVGTIGQTFLGLTLNCARCHDHKFDPIRQREYYQLAATVAGVHHGQREVNSQANRLRLNQIDNEVRTIEAEIAELDGVVRNRLRKLADANSDDLPPRVRPLARWDFEKDTRDVIGEVHAVQHPQAKVAAGRLILDAETGYAASHTQKTRLREKTLEVWVRLDGLKQRGGSAMTVHHKSGAFDAIVFGEREPGKWMPGSDFHKRTKNLDAPPETEAADSFVHLAISYHADGAIACFRNGEPYGKPYPSDGPQLYDPGEWYVMFGLRNGGPAAQRQLRGLLETAQLYNRALSAEQVRASFDCEQAAITHNSILAALTNDERKRREELHSSLVRLIEQRKQHEARSVYVVAAEKPKTAFVLHRGNPAQRREQVAPGGVAALAGKSPHFQLAVDAGDSERRRELASWITSELNPLFSRVIVNRLWHYHFGSGIVETPNDFGFNGGRPSHPQLLDWLAAELVKSDWSLKHIHRLIVTSGVYLQSSRFREAPSRVDANNRSLWRMNPQRLEAEALRDSILHVSGQLNRQYGGPPYRDFKTFVNNTQFYEIIDPDTPDAYRRTVYRAWIRSGRSPLLDAFDCPDPSTTAPRRAVTTTPVQSLALLNNSFVLRMADRFADRVAKVAGDDAARQADSVYRFAYGRSPAPTELEPLTTFIAEHGLPAFCRVVFNSNEFIHVD